MAAAKRKKTASLRDVLSEGISLRIRNVLKRLEQTRQDPSVKNTHDLTTALRRLQVVDRVARDFYGKGFLGEERSLIRNYRKGLGSVRDVQEIRLKFRALELDCEAAEAYSQHLARREGAARRKVKGLKVGFNRRRLEDLRQKRDVMAWFDEAPRKAPAKVLGKLLRRVLAWAPDAVQRKDDAALHRMRVVFKRFRYAYEVLTPEITGGSNKTLQYLKRIQDAMGEAHDWVVLEDDFKAWRKSRTGVQGVRRVMTAIRRQRERSHAAGRRYVARELATLRKLAEI